MNDLQSNLPIFSDLDMQFDSVHTETTARITKILQDSEEEPIGESADSLKNQVTHLQAKIEMMKSEHEEEVKKLRELSKKYVADRLSTN